MYPFWFITWDDFPLRNCCSDSANVRNGERPWTMGIAQNYIPCSNQTWQWDILYELEVVIQVSMGYGFDEFSIPPLDGHRLPPKKKTIFNYSTWPTIGAQCMDANLCNFGYSAMVFSDISWLAIIFLFSHRLNRQNFGGPRSKKTTAPKDGDGFSNKHNCELPHRPLAIEEW